MADCLFCSETGDETSVLRGGGGGGGELVLLDQKGVAEVVPNGRTFQSLINRGVKQFAM